MENYLKNSEKWRREKLHENSKFVARNSWTKNGEFTDPLLTNLVNSSNGKTNAGIRIIATIYQQLIKAIKCNDVFKMHLNILF